MKQRCAYTLVEMLIVMLLLAMFVGLAWPTLRSPWGQSKLEDAAEQVRAAMADARREAILSVSPWQFCYRAGAADYVIGPLHLGEEENSGQTKNDTENDSRSLEELDSPEPELIVRQLPHGVTFCDPEVDLASELNFSQQGLVDEGLAANHTTSEPVDTSLSSEDLAAELQSGEWSKPVVFFPNGRSTSDRLQLRGSGTEVRLISIRVRGIIGSADVGKPRRIRQTEQLTELAIEPIAEEGASP